MNDEIKWTTELEGPAQRVLKAAKKDSSMQDFQRYKVKDEIDALTVPELRAVSEQLALELSRLSELAEYVKYAQSAIRKEVGL